MICAIGRLRNGRLRNGGRSRDAIPGQENEFDVDVLDRTGDFPNTGVCAEFCGLDHAYMRFDVRIVTPAEFQAWAAEHAQQSQAAAP